MRSRERSKGPRASVAACPARSTRQAERLRWILHTFSRRNFPSSVGPTTRFSPSRQIPLPRAEEQDRVRQETGKKFHPQRSTCTNSPGPRRRVSLGSHPGPANKDARLVGTGIFCSGIESHTITPKNTRDRQGPVCPQCSATLHCFCCTDCS